MAVIQDDNVPVLFVGVPELPKGALIEKQVLVHTGRCDLEDDDVTTIRRNVAPVYVKGEGACLDEKTC